MWPNKIQLCVTLALLMFGSGAWGDFRSVYPGFGGAKPQNYAFATLAHSRPKDVAPDGRSSVEAIHRLGFALQKPHNRGPFQYGWEAGATLGYDSNRNLFVRLSGSFSYVEVQSDLWTGDFYFGSFISARPVDDVRLYASAGGALYWGRLSGVSDARARDPQRGGSVVIDTRDGRGDWGQAGYVQAGVEYIVSPRTTFGLNVRYLDSTLNFGDRGRVDQSVPVYGLTLGYHF